MDAVELLTKQGYDLRAQAIELIAKTAIALLVLTVLDLVKELAPQIPNILHKATPVIKTRHDGLTRV